MAVVSLAAGYASKRDSSPIGRPRDGLGHRLRPAATRAGGQDAVVVGAERHENQVGNRSGRRTGGLDPSERELRLLSTAMTTRALIGRMMSPPRSLRNKLAPLRRRTRSPALRHQTTCSEGPIHIQQRQTCRPHSLPRSKAMHQLQARPCLRPGTSTSPVRPSAKVTFSRPRRTTETAVMSGVSPVIEVA